MAEYKGRRRYVKGFKCKIIPGASARRVRIGRHFHAECNASEEVVKGAPFPRSLSFLFAIELAAPSKKNILQRNAHSRDREGVVLEERGASILRYPTEAYVRVHSLSGFENSGIIRHRLVLGAWIYRKIVPLGTLSNDETPKQRRAPTRTSTSGSRV